MSKRWARKPVTPKTTLPNMMPMSGTSMTSFACMRSTNATKSQVPAMAAAKAKRALSQIVEAGMKRSASRMPSCANWIVAPVVGETNLFAQSCCMMRPAMLIPAPVQRTARSLGRRESRKRPTCAASPARSAPGVMSPAPAKRLRTETTRVAVRSTSVDRGMMVVRKKSYRVIVACVIVARVHGPRMSRSLHFIWVRNENRSQLHSVASSFEKFTDA